MLRSINELDLPESAKLKLRNLGYEYCEDIKREIESRNSISSNLRSIIDKYALHRQLYSHVLRDVKSSVDVWNSECLNPPVAIFHEGLDKLLRGGFPIGRITELCGPPGSGKTQLCLQAAVDVQIPRKLGGSSAECLFIYTDFGFTVDRLRQIAEASAEHISSICNKENYSSEAINFTVDTILSGVNVIPVFGCKELFKIVTNLEKVITSNKNIKLVIIDSFSLPFVCESVELLERTKMINVMLDVMLEVSMKFSFAVLLTNQLTTIITSNSEKKLIPSLGESFGHRLHKRFLLDDGKICLMKSIDKPQMYTEFQITKAGIR